MTYDKLIPSGAHHDKAKHRKDKQPKDKYLKNKHAKGKQVNESVLSHAHNIDLNELVTASTLAMKGRGAVSNPSNRYDSESMVKIDDGWTAEVASTSVQTKLIPAPSKTIISSNSSPDISFSKSINPYRGCEHGCIYCYARPTHAFWDMSPGLDFETNIFVKANAAEMLEQTLNKPGYQCEPICIGANTDPYQPCERTERVTRGVLEVMQKHRHPFSIITKSDLMLRDIEIYEEMARDKLCSVAVSLTTLSNETKRKLEPRTASPAARLRLIEQLSLAGVPVTVLAAPMIPAVNDHEMEAILASAANAGAKYAEYIFLRLPLEIEMLFTEWLTEHYPGRAKHVMSIVRQSREGKSYQSGFHTRMKGRGVFADLLHQRFNIALRKLGLNEEYPKSELNTRAFQPANQQLQLF